MDYDFSCNVQMKEQETELGEDKRFVIRSRSLSSLFQLTLSDVSEEQQARPRPKPPHSPPYFFSRMCIISCREVNADCACSNRSTVMLKLANTRPIMNTQNARYSSSYHS